MSRSSKKANRLLQVEALLLAHPEGLTPSELARKLQVNRSTISRYMVDLPGHIYLDDLDGGKWKIDREGYLVNVRFNLHEALAVHLAARLLATRLDRQNPHAAAALRKLGVSLEMLAPQISQHVKQSADLMDDTGRFQDPRYVQVLEKLALAWAERRKVRIWHRYEKTDTVHEYVFAPYFIEPYAVGQTTHVIGWREDVNALRTFKVERIERIEETRNPAEFYDIPSDFDPRRLLTDAWGIWYTEAEPQEVVLRFSATVAARVRETLWHGSQKLEEMSDGRLLWRAQVAEPREMLPWIRGWGSDVEVAEPDWLREELKNHARKLAQLYQTATQQEDLDSRLLRLWGKTVKRSDIFHPALYHMLDVAHIAQQLLSPRTTARWRQVLGRALGTDPDTLHEWLPFLIALHDLGKLSVPFQVLNDVQVKRLREEGFDLGKATHEDGRKLHHTIVGRLLLEKTSFDWPISLKAAFLSMVGGHHGIYRLEVPDDERRLKLIQEPEEWTELRQHAIQLLRSYFVTQWPDPLPEPANVSAAIAVLNGFCILCDWLGSDENYFSPRPHTPLPKYVQHSRQQAYERVKDAGFFHTAVSQAPTTFTGLFEFSPRPLQAAIDQIPHGILAHPTLTIIEAPTGEGKTEAALALARRIAAIHGTDEMYIALPTTATSNAMYTRIQEHLQDRLGLPPQLVQLVHGQSFLAQDDLAIQPLVNGDGEEQVAMDWFAPKKKALLAPFGVGTIDQAMLSALNVKHNALRLMGLAGKVIILDEVHAYDTYMTTIIKRMLAWLSALGSSVILLSATLPKRKRQELIDSFAGGTAVSLPNPEQYPSLITINTAGELHTLIKPLAVYQPDKTVELDHLHFTDEQAAAKAQWLWQQVQHGGCACWITNTVDRAINIYRQLQRTVPSDVDLTLIHGRLPQEHRQHVEDLIKGKYGKEGTRPVKGIVVGTQVLEQSLDLDFDVMATDLAPIDLLLQRGGRLFRHERELAVRGPHQNPHFYVNAEPTRADQAIYTEYILNATTEALNGRAQLCFPADYRPLIEAVYGKANPKIAGYRDIMKLEAKLKGEANIRLAEEPDPDEPFCEVADWAGFEESEDEGSRAWVAALTRWGQESITVVPLHRVGDSAVPIHTDNQTPIAINTVADRETQLRLLRRSLRLSNQSLITYLKAQKRAESCALFARSSLLKHVYPLWLQPHSQIADVFINEESKQPIYLHPDLGLVMGTPGKEI